MKFQGCIKFIDQRTGFKCNLYKEHRNKTLIAHKYISYEAHLQIKASRFQGWAQKVLVRPWYHQLLLEQTNMVSTKNCRPSSGWKTYLVHLTEECECNTVSFTRNLFQSKSAGVDYIFGNTIGSVSLSSKYLCTSWNPLRQQ